MKKKAVNGAWKGGGVEIFFLVSLFYAEGNKFVVRELKNVFKKIGKPKKGLAIKALSPCSSLMAVVFF